MQLDSWRPVLSSALVAPDLDIYIDSGLTMQADVTKTVSSCFTVLRHIRSTRHSVTEPVLQSLIVSMVLTLLDYESATLAGLPNTLLSRLQSVLQAAARQASKRTPSKRDEETEK